MRFSRFYFIVIAILVLLAGGVSVLVYSAVVIKRTFASRIDNIPSSPPALMNAQTGTPAPLSPAPEPAPSTDTPPTPANVPSGTQLRAMLKAQGMDEKVIAKMTDEQLVNLYQEFLKSQQNKPSSP